MAGALAGCSPTQTTADPASARTSQATSTNVAQPVTSAPATAATTIVKTVTATASAPQASTTSRVPVSANVTLVNEASFASPSGHLTCRLGGISARCDVGGPTFSPPSRPASCRYEWGQTVELEVGRPAEFACVSDPSYKGGDTTAPFWYQPGVDARSKIFRDGGYALGYGHVLQSASIKCVIDPSSGVTCQTLDGRHGFTLAMQAYKTW